MEFRYVQVDLLAGSFDVATNLDVGAWTAEYPYDAAESSFDSSDATLNGVYELARWTVEAGVLDKDPRFRARVCCGRARFEHSRSAHSRTDGKIRPDGPSPRYTDRTHHCTCTHARQGN